MALLLLVLITGCTLDTTDSRQLASVKVGGIRGELNEPLAASNVEIRTVVLEMQPLLQVRGFKLIGNTAALARFRTSIGYQASYNFSHGASSGEFQCRVDGDRERIEVEFIEYTMQRGVFGMTTAEREFIYDSARLLRDHLQAKFPGRKVQVSFTTYE